MLEDMIYQSGVAYHSIRLVIELALIATIIVVPTISWNRRYTIPWYIFCAAPTLFILACVLGTLLSKDVAKIVLETNYLVFPFVCLAVIVAGLWSLSACVAAIARWWDRRWGRG